MHDAFVVGVGAAKRGVQDGGGVKSGAARIVRVLFSDSTQETTREVVTLKSRA